MASIDIVDRLRFDAVRCEATFSKGVAGNITEAADEIERLRSAIRTYAWHKQNCEGNKDGAYILEHCECGYRDLMFGEHGVYQQSTADK